MADGKTKPTTTPLEEFTSTEGDLPAIVPTTSKTTGVPEGYSRELIFGGVSKPRVVKELTYTTGALAGQPLTQINPVTGETEPVGMYDIYKEAGTILNSLDDVERKTILEGLKSRNIGYTKNEKPGNGFTPGDRQAMTELLLQSNINLMPWRETFLMLQKRVAPVPEAGVKRTYRITPDEDLEAVVQASSQQLLGRNLSNNDVRRISKYIQQAELEAQKKAVGGGVVEDIPSAQSLALQQVEKKYGAESDNVKMMSFAEMLNQAVANRG